MVPKVMQDRMINYFLKFGSLNTDERAAILENLVVEEYPKGFHLLREGEKSFVNYFVLKGCVRRYNLKDDEESTTRFYTEDSWVLPAIGQAEEGVIDYNLQCLEACMLVIASEKEGNQLIHQFPKFQEVSQRILEREILHQQKHLAQYLNSTPEQRYLQLQQDTPELIERIPLYQLSSYLGVKPESLSRIRKRIAIRG